MYNYFPYSFDLIAKKFLILVGKYTVEQTDLNETQNNQVLGLKNPIMTYDKII